MRREWREKPSAAAAPQPKWLRFTIAGIVAAMILVAFSQFLLLPWFMRSGLSAKSGKFHLAAAHKLPCLRALEGPRSRLCPCRSASHRRRLAKGACRRGPAHYRRIVARARKSPQNLLRRRRQRMFLAGLFAAAEFSGHGQHLFTRPRDQHCALRDRTGLRATQDFYCYGQWQFERCGPAGQDGPGIEHAHLGGVAIGR